MAQLNTLRRGGQGTAVRLSRGALLALCALMAGAGYLSASLPLLAAPSLLRHAATAGDGPNHGLPEGANAAGAAVPQRRLRAAPGANLPLPISPAGGVGGPTTVSAAEVQALVEPRAGAGGAGGTAAAAAAAVAAVAPPAEPEEFAAGYLSASGLSSSRPPVATGKSGEGAYRVVAFQILSWYPRIVLFPSFLSSERCDRIVAVTKAKGLSKTPVAYEADAAANSTQEIRTSSGVFISSAEDPGGDLRYLEEKIAAATMLPVSHGEPFNVLRYEVGQVFEAHMDAFDAEGAFKSNNQRVATVITYLSDVEEGGETAFHWEGQDGLNRPFKDWRNCRPDDGSFKVKPRKGDALLFYSLDPDLKVNHRSLHGSCPVTKGEKWAATRWIFQRPFVQQGSIPPPQ